MRDLVRNFKRNRVGPFDYNRHYNHSTIKQYIGINALGKTVKSAENRDGISLHKKTKGICQHETIQYNILFYFLFLCFVI
jgi:hypothetical protein